MINSSAINSLFSGASSAPKTIEIKELDKGYRVEVTIPPEKVKIVDAVSYFVDIVRKKETDIPGESWKKNGENEEEDEKMNEEPKIIKMLFTDVKEMMKFLRPSRAQVSSNNSSAMGSGGPEGLALQTGQVSTDARFSV